MTNQQIEIILNGHGAYIGKITHLIDNFFFEHYESGHNYIFHICEDDLKNGLNSGDGTMVDLKISRCKNIKCNTYVPKQIRPFIDYAVACGVITDDS